MRNLIFQGVRGHRESASHTKGQGLSWYKSLKGQNLEMYSRPTQTLDQKGTRSADFAVDHLRQGFGLEDRNFMILPLEFLCSFNFYDFMILQFHDSDYDSITMNLQLHDNFTIL